MPEQKRLKLGRMDYINLDKNSNRKEHVESQFARYAFDVPLNRFSAIVGKTHQFTAKETSFFTKAGFLALPGDLPKHIMGNFLSHFSLWQAMTKLDEDECGLILQDDVILVDSFSNDLQDVLNDVPTDAEIIWLSMHEYSAYEKFVPVDLKLQTIKDNKIKFFEFHPNKTMHIGGLSITTNPCSLAYLITPCGARNLIQELELNGVKRATDYFMNDFFHLRKIQYASYKVLATSSSDLFKSDIFTYE